jgi:hypothetical protein
MEQFTTNENKVLLWDLIEENLYLEATGKKYIYSLFNQHFNPFFQSEYKKSNSLMELNKKYILFIKNQINEYDKKTQMITFEDIKKNKVSQLDNEYQNQKNDFENSINIKPPPVPDFKIATEDEPLMETDKLIKEMIKSRNYEIDMVYKKNDNMIKNTDNMTKDPNKNYIHINEELDKSVYEKDIEILEQTDKHISWADEQTSLNFFDKLKKKLPDDNYKNDIIILHTKMNELNIKMEALNMKIDTLITQLKH